MKKNVMIAGYYGFNNTGDESILASMLADLRALEPAIHPLVISGDPEATAKLHNVAAIQWTNLDAIIAGAEAANLIILGGGGLFHDYWGFNPDTLLVQNHSGLSFFAGIPLLATLLNKPCMLYSVGIGPLFSEVGKSFTRATVEQAWITTVRDAESKTLLESLGVAPERVHLTADPAFRLQPASPQRAQQILQQENLLTTDAPVLGVCLRNWDVGVVPDHWEAEVARTLDLFLERFGGVIRFLPFQDLPGALVDDAILAERVRSLMQNASQATIWQGAYTPQERAALLGTCDIVLGMRLHSLILALRQNKPVVALVYDSKVSSVMKQAGCAELMLPIESFTATALFDLLKTAYLERDERRASLSASVNQLIELGQTNAQLAVSLLREPRSPAPPITTETLSLLKRLALDRTRQAQSLLTQTQQLLAQFSQQVQIIGQLKADHEQRWLTQLNQQEQNIGQLNADHEQRWLAQLNQQEQNIGQLKADHEQRWLVQLNQQEQIIIQLKTDHEQRWLAQLNQQEQIISQLKADHEQRWLAQLNQQEQIISQLKADHAQTTDHLKRIGETAQQQLDTIYQAPIGNG